MAQLHRRHSTKNIDNSGFGNNSNAEGGRLTNKDGSTNLRKVGKPFWERISMYHTLLRMNGRTFLLCVILFYTTVNLIFAAIYYLVGVNHLLGTETDVTKTGQFLEAFFFSSQTLTTVGYGHVAPMGWTTNFIASSESLIGILIFALVTGLMYGRFARPRAYILFSDSMLISPYKEGTGLMFRLATFKNNHLTDAEALVTLVLHLVEDDKHVSRFFPLTLEINKVNSLALSWTIVHKIDENSPLYHFTEADMQESNMELIVAIKAFDDHFSNIVQQRTSYTYHELVYGAKFQPMFHRSEKGTHTILELDRVDAHEPANLPKLHTNAAGELTSVS